MGKPLRVLLVEDSPDDVHLIVRALQRGGYEPHYRQVDRADSLRNALAAEPWDVVLSDHHMPHFDSMAALDIVKGSGLDTPFLIVSGSIGEEAAVRAMKAGAQDYLMKGNLARLCAAIERELQDAADRRARQAAEKSLFLQSENLRIAREVQQRLFPAASPVLPGFDIAGASQPAEATGGDYFDYIPMGNGRVAFVVGDVTGHGLGPALLMADVRAYLRAVALSHSDIRDILTRATHLLGDDFGLERFVSLIILSLAPETRTLTYVNAGHPDGYVLDAGGAIRVHLRAMLPALGLAPETGIPPALHVTLQPGDLVLLMTDGIAEACSPTGEEFGNERALEIVRAAQEHPASDMVRGLFDAVLAFTAAAELQDDITAVVIKVLP